MIGSAARCGGQDPPMTFTWEVPPWQRDENCTHMAVTLTDVGDGQIALNSESVRGENAVEALSDLLMGPGGAGGMVPLSGLSGVVVKRGIDVMWMAQPPIQVAANAEGAGTSPSRVAISWT
ncbi:hypothetical protein GCM10020254_82320 [Streptomyces goshikiensis]